jgi:tetratricopeptide (TPR) repeat protein
MNCIGGGLMKKKSKKLKSGVMVSLLGLLVNSCIFELPVAAAAAAIPGRTAQNVQNKRVKGWLQWVEQQKYDQAVIALHNGKKRNDIDNIAEITALKQKNVVLELLKNYVAKYRPHKRDIDSLHRYAVELARGNRLQEALTLLGWLHDNQPQNTAILEDDIVVSGWARQYRQVVHLFETSTLPEAVTVPAYVLNGVGGAYYNLQNFAKAETCFAKAAAQNNHFARIWQAQSYYRLGERQKADQIYAALLNNNPQDIDVLRSQASMNLWGGHNEEALAELKHLKKLPINDPAIVKAVDYNLAIAYMRLDEAGNAILLLKPYVDKGQADAFMQSDYVLALFDYGDYEKATLEAQRLWKDWSKVPTFGLQAYADSYVRMGKIKNNVEIMKKALPIYEYILQKRDKNNKDAFLSMGFSYLMEGDISQGLPRYDQAIEGNRKVAEIALSDAYYFFSLGKFRAGKSLYELVLQRYPSVSLYRREYADQLENQGMDREAFRQYQILKNTQGGQIDGLQGEVNMTIRSGDYRSADHALKTLQVVHPESMDTFYADKEYAERVKGQLAMNVSTTADYKGYSTTAWTLNAGQTIQKDSNYEILTQWGRSKISSQTANTILKTRGIGVGFKDMACDYQLWYNHYQNNGTFNGYNFDSHYYPSDHLSFDVGVSRAPLEYSPESLDPQLAGDTDSRIMTNNYTFNTHIKEGRNEDYDINYTYSRYSDQNTVNSFGLDWTKTLVYNNRYEAYRTLYWSEDKWRMQRPDLYDSPQKRYTYGISKEEIWKYSNKIHWDLTYALEFGQDYSEDTELQPYAGLSYLYLFSPHKILTLSAEYGFRTERTNGSNSLMHFSYRQYGINYTMNW